MELGRLYLIRQVFLTKAQRNPHNSYQSRFELYIIPSATLDKIQIGKNFKSKVYQVVARIKKGQVLSYQEVARRAGNKKAARAVGNILNKHKIKGLPCHRVIRSDGRLGGYRWGIRKKMELLKKEGVKIKGMKIIK